MALAAHRNLHRHPLQWQALAHPLPAHHLQLQARHPVVLLLRAPAHLQ